MPLHLRILGFQDLARVKFVRRSVFVHGIGKHQGVSRAMREDTKRGEVRHQVHIQISRAHIDAGGIDDFTQRIKHINGVSNVDATRCHTVEKPLRWNPLAAQVTVGIGNCHFDGVNAVVVDPLLQDIELRTDHVVLSIDSPPSGPTSLRIDH
jgi:hypothetical protein